MDVFKTLILDTPDSLENISGVLPVVNGGTGADNAPDARVNLLPNYTGNANKVLSLNGTATDVEWTSNGAGDVAGPASSTDNAVVRFDSTTGKLIQNSGVTISDANLLTTTDLTVNDDTVLGSSNTDTVTFNARSASEFTPATDNTYDLGGTGHEWRDLYIDGTANIDSLVADTADINGGTIDGTAIGATTPSTVAATTASASTSVTTPSVTNAGTLALSATGANIITASTNGVERMRISSAGNVGIGTAGPNSKLEVAGVTTNNDGIRLEGSGSNLRLMIQNASGITGERAFSLTNNSAVKGLLFQALDNSYNFVRNVAMFGHDGNVGIGTTSPAQALHVVGEIIATGNITAYYSDDRLKTKLGNIENALDKVSKLNGFYYEANETAQALGYKPVREVGLSAQQVEAVLPEVVAPAPIDNEYKTLHYERVIPLLVEAIKELKAEIELLKK